MPAARDKLPIDDALPEILAALRAQACLVIEAPPGAGKTTRVPPALLDSGIVGAQHILVLEPRRMAARLSARRVAEERGERVGETIGYQVRFDDQTGPRTRITYLTEGLFSRRLLDDPTCAAWARCCSTSSTSGTCNPISRSRRRCGSSARARGAT